MIGFSGRPKIVTAFFALASLASQGLFLSGSLIRLIIPVLAEAVFWDLPAFISRLASLARCSAPRQLRLVAAAITFYAISIISISKNAAVRMQKNFASPLALPLLLNV